MPGTGWGAADLLASGPVAAGAWHRVRGADLLASMPIATGAWHLGEFPHWNAGIRLGGPRWETLANFGVWVAFDGPGSS